MKKYYNETESSPMIAQLLQLTSLTWDGDLISKQERDKLMKEDLAQRIPKGWNLITARGIEYLEMLELINP